MNNAQVLHGQESFPIELLLRPRKPFPGAVPYLNEHEGFIELEDLPDFNLDWKREVTLMELMGEIGVALSSERPHNEISDGPLAAYGKDFENLLPSIVEPSLYYSGPEARRRTDVLTCAWAEPNFVAPGVIGQDQGVAVTSTEFRTVSKNAGLLAKHASAHVGKSHEGQLDDDDKKIDDEDLKNRKGRGAAHILEDRMRLLTDMGKVLELEHIGISGFQELIVFGEDAPKRTLGEMDYYRRVGMFVMLQMFRVASGQLDYGTNERQGATRALITTFTRWKKPERRIAAMQVYARMASNYTNAKRGKVAQAYSDCEIEYRKYKPFLGTKEPTVDITERS